MLYEYSIPNGEFTVILPVGVAHVGCEIVTSAKAGTTGAESIIISVVTEVHPALLFTVML
ncbi:hypothetical protein D3C87_538950 [compost metagenome]